jgi:hypothetical protein
LKDSFERFEVLVNGKRACIAGQAGDGCLSVALQYCRLAPARSPEYSDEGTESTCLTVRAHDDAQGEMQWLQLPLQPGDEITLRILGPGPADTPAETFPHVSKEDLPF